YYNVISCRCSVQLYSVQNHLNDCSSTVVIDVFPNVSGVPSLFNNPLIVSLISIPWLTTNKCLLGYLITMSLTKSIPLSNTDSFVSIPRSNFLQSGPHLFILSSSIVPCILPRLISLKRLSKKAIGLFISVDIISAVCTARFKSLAISKSQSSLFLVSLEASAFACLKPVLFNGLFE